MPIVSVIMPAYRVTEYIAEAVDSVLVQSFRDFELIVVNDGCPDTAALESVLAKYSGDIRYIKQANGGIASARNTGIAASSAEFIALLDSDDRWAPEYLEAQVSFLKAHPDMDLVYADAVFFGDSMLTGRRFMEITPSEGVVNVESLLNRRCSVMVSVTARREAIVRAGMFDASLRSVEDFDMWIRLLLNGSRIAYQRRALTYYRKRPTSLSADTLQMRKYQLKVLDKISRDPRFNQAWSEALDDTRRWVMAEGNLTTGKRALLAGDYATAHTALTAAQQYFRRPKLAIVLLLLRTFPAAARWLLAHAATRK